MNDRMKQKVAIIGHGFTSRLGVIRALGKCGYYIIDVAITSDRKLLKKQNNRPIDAYSRYVNEFYYAPADHEGLIRFLFEKCADDDQKVVLLPESDFAAISIDAAYDRLKDKFCMPNIDGKPGRVIYWMDKERQKAQARKMGLNVAQSCIIEVRNREFTIPDDVRYPCFAKPVSTLQGGKKGVGRCNNKQELEDRLNKISSFNPSLDVLVEDFLQIDKEYALVGFSDGERVIIPGIIYTTHLGQGNHFGVAIAGKVLPPEPFGTLIKQFRELIRSIHLVGLFDIDFFGCGQQYYFGEINLRIGGSGTAVLSCSDNLAKKYVDFVSTGKYDETTVLVRDAVTFVNERMCLDDWYGGWLSSEMYKKLTNDSEISFIKDKTDARPYVRFQKLYREKLFKKITKRLFQKQIKI